MATTVKHNTQTAHDTSSSFYMEEKNTKKKANKKSTIKKLAKILIGFILLSLTATEVLMFTLFGRIEPLTDRPFDILTWASEKNYISKSLEFMSGASKLKGYYIVPPNARAVIMLVHGVHSSTDVLEPVIKYLVEHAYAVMTFDGTASGRSSGNITVGLQQQRFDIRSALSVIRNEQDINELPLVLMGHSAGAYGAAVEAELSEAEAIVCVSGFESPLNTMRFWANRYVSILAEVEYPFILAREYAAKGEYADEYASDALCATSIPTLVIQGKDDEIIYMNISLYQAMQQKDASNITMILEEDPDFSNHTNILVTETGINDNMLNNVLMFLDPLF